jgi:hypothetical protein
VSTHDGLSISLGPDEIFCALVMGMSGTLYHINCVEMQNNSAYAVSSGSLRLWHQQMGHLHLDAIWEMMQKNMVNGLTVFLPKDYDHVCEGCVLGKSHWLPLPKASTTTYELMDLIVVNLTGPMSIETWSGMSYALVIVKVSCRYPVRQLLKTKTEADANLQEIIAMLKRQSGKNLKWMWRDNGSEFVKELTDAFCCRNGIIHKMTVPYTPEKNGIVERAITTLFEMARCTLYSANMDLCYWGEAFMYAVHIQSCSPLLALNGVVLSHAWSGKKPDVSHLQIFGLVAYANIQKKV